MAEKKSSSKKTFYHYTDAESARQILTTGHIKQSGLDGPVQDARFGQAVYGTTIDPHSHSVKSIAYNNWDDATLPEQKIQAGKMDVAFEITVPKTKVSMAPTKRDVVLHHGDVKTKNITDVMVRDDSGQYKSVAK